MMTRMLAWLTAHEKSTDAAVVVLWALAIASVLMQALTRTAFPSLADYVLLFAICIAAGAVLNDFSKALVGYAIAMLGGLTALFLLAALPVSLGVVPSPADQVVESLWIGVIFQSVFPFPVVGLFLASILGAGLGEKYFG